MIQYNGTSFLNITFDGAPGYRMITQYNGKHWITEMSKINNGDVYDIIGERIVSRLSLYDENSTNKIAAIKRNLALTGLCGTNSSKMKTAMFNLLIECINKRNKNNATNAQISNEYKNQ